eukprot:g1432.t1
MLVAAMLCLGLAGGASGDLLRAAGTRGGRGPLRSAIEDIQHESSAVDKVLQDSEGIVEGLTQSLLTTSHGKERANSPALDLDRIDSGAQQRPRDNSASLPQSGYWKTISVWVRPSDVIPKGPKFHSQVGQDKTVVKAFSGKRGGFYVDLAANDPVALSNTLALERDYGWSGICIEANPQYWPRLAHRQCQVFGTLVGENDYDQLDVALNQRGVYGGIVGTQFDNKRKTSEPKRRSVSLESILVRASAPSVIDYFSLDVEGAEEFIMKGFPFPKYRFNVLTVERPSARLQQILKDNSYVYVRDHGSFGDQMWHHALFTPKLE